MKKLLPLLITACGLIACKETRFDPLGISSIHYSEHLVTWYYTAYNYTYTSQSSGKNIVLVISEQADLYSADIMPDKYAQYCNKYNDQGFNGYVADPGVTACANDISQITITCNCDYQGHKAGEDLGDITDIRIKTVKPFIDSKYTKTTTGDNPAKSDDGKTIFSPTNDYSLLTKKVSELTATDLYLYMRDTMVMELPQPETDEQLEFTITLTGADGNKYTVKHQQ